tara:strand:- start:4071 stop:4802 length:732 start_codon:yes stop_codon:yes gene_type:complete
VNNQAINVTNDYSKLANKYSKSPIKGTGYLAFRDLPKIILENNKGQLPKAVLDYGCGTGRSTRFIKELGIDHVVGLDQSSDMINIANQNNDACEYFHISNNQIPFSNNNFDCVISTFVMLEISSEAELLDIFVNINSKIKKGGFFTFVTNSEYLYNKNWVSNSTNYPETKIFKDGEKLKIYLKNIDQELYDYYWSDKKYRELLKKANFSSISCHTPIGRLGEPFDWLDELYYPPFSIYTAFKY